MVRDGLRLKGERRSRSKIWKSLRNGNADCLMCSRKSFSCAFSFIRYVNSFDCEKRKEIETANREIYGFLCSSSAGWNVTYSEIIVSITGLCDSTRFQTGNRTRNSIGLLKCCFRMRWNGFVPEFDLIFSPFQHRKISCARNNPIQREEAIKSRLADKHTSSDGDDCVYKWAGECKKTDQLLMTPSPATPTPKINWNEKSKTNNRTATTKHAVYPICVHHTRKEDGTSNNCDGENKKRA